MIRKPWLVILSFLFLMICLTGCPKKVPIPSIEAPSVEDPVTRLLESFSSADSVQAKTSIRLDTVRKGEESRYLIQGILLYQKPDKLRLMGYHPIIGGLFDAIYQGEKFVLFSYKENRAYIGELSEFRDLIAEAHVRMSVEHASGNKLPERIRFELPEKQTRIEFTLTEILVNPALPKDAFEWVAPEGTDVQPLSKFLKEKKPE